VNKTLIVNRLTHNRQNAHCSYLFVGLWIFFDSGHPIAELERLLMKRRSGKVENHTKMQIMEFRLWLSRIRNSIQKEEKHSQTISKADTDCRLNEFYGRRVQKYFPENFNSLHREEFLRPAARK
jgi:hypothetical protein